MLSRLLYSKRLDYVSSDTILRTCIFFSVKLWVNECFRAEEWLVPSWLLEQEYDAREAVSNIPVNIVNNLNDLKLQLYK